MPRRRRVNKPWYARTLEVSTIFIGICAVQVMFSKHVDKDEYQRIIGTSIVFAVREILGGKKEQ